MWIIKNSKIKIVPFIELFDEIGPLLMERSKYKNGVERFDSFVLFRRNSFGYINGNNVLKKGLSKLKISSR